MTINYYDYLLSSVDLAVPLAFAALGGMYSERSGVLNIALEGLLLTGAFSSAIATFYTGNPYIGIIFALIIGGCVGLVHAFLSVTLAVNQLVSGLGINLLVAGLTSFFARLVFNGNSTRLPGIEAIAIPGLAKIPLLGTILFQQNILVYFLVILVAFSLYFLFYTSLGLTLRSVGEYPQAAATAGLSVSRVRYVAVIVSGCLASLGGAYLTLVQINFFTEGMSAGKGFIALAALIFGRWHPLGIIGACFLFGATEALQLRIQAFGVNIPYQFLVMSPYALALFALLGLAGKALPPRSLGIPYFPENRQDE